MLQLLGACCGIPCAWTNPNVSKRKTFIQQLVADSAPLSSSANQRENTIKWRSQHLVPVMEQTETLNISVGRSTNT